MKLRKVEEPVCEMDMTPMIDCTFQLLIFFMVAASMSKVDQTPEIQLPIAPKAAKPEEEDLRGRGTINIAPIGTPTADGAVSEARPFMISGQLCDEATLTKLIAARAEAVPDFRVYMRVDKNAEFKTVKRAIRACANAGVFNIIFGTFQSKSAGEEG